MCKACDAQDAYELSREQEREQAAYEASYVEDARRLSRYDLAVKIIRSVKDVYGEDGFQCIDDCKRFVAEEDQCQIS